MHQASGLAESAALNLRVKPMMLKREGRDALKGSSLLRGIKAEVLTRVDMRRAQVLYKSLKPEMVKSSKIGKLRLTLSKEGLLLTISAKEASKMRAGISSYLRLIKAAIETLNMVE